MNWLGVSVILSFVSCKLNLFKTDILVLNESNIISSLQQYLNKIPGAIFYYKPGSSSELIIKSKLKKLASDLSGSVRVGVFNCVGSEKFCEFETDRKLENDEYILRVYPTIPQSPFNLENIDDISKVQKILIKKTIPAKIQYLESEIEVQSFLAADPIVPKVFLISNKKKPHIIYNSVAHYFDDRVNFAFTNSKAIARKLGGSLPFSILIKSGNTDLSKKNVHKFTDELNFKNLQSFINIFSETFSKGGGVVDSFDSSNIAKKWLVDALPEFTMASREDLCNEKMTGCLLVLKDVENVSEKDISTINQFKNLFNKSKLKFNVLWLRRDKKKQDLDFLMKYDLVYVNPKRHKFVGIILDEELQLNRISRFMEDVESGFLKYKKFSSNKYFPDSNREKPTEL